MVVMEMVGREREKGWRRDGYGVEREMLMVVVMDMVEREVGGSAENCRRIIWCEGCRIISHRLNKSKVKINSCTVSNFLRLRAVALAGKLIEVAGQN